MKGGICGAAAKQDVMRGRVGRWLVVLLVLGGMPGATAGAHVIRGERLLFEAPIPCAAACPAFHESIDTACALPLLPGSYDSFITRPAPEPSPGKVVVLEATLDPTIDRDLYLCTLEGYVLAISATHVGDPCDQIIGTGDQIVGCHEDVSVALRPGEQVVIRGFNVSDVTPANGVYGFTFVSAPGV